MRVSFKGLDAEAGEKYRLARFQQCEYGLKSSLANSDTYITQHGVAGEDITEVPCLLLARSLENSMGDIQAQGLKGRAEASEFFPKAAEETYLQLKDLPGGILSNKDFWRYLAVHTLFDVVRWQYPSNNGDRWGTNPSQFNRNMPIALFIRGQLSAMCSPEDREILNKINDVDVWTSHVVAVLYGSAPQAVVPYMEILSTWQDPKYGGFNEKSRDVLRELARLLTAARSNYVFDLADPVTAREIVYSLVPEAERRGALRGERRDIERAAKKLAKASKEAKA
jgi:hypothetical protein